MVSVSGRACMNEGYQTQSWMSELHPNHTKYLSGLGAILLSQKSLNAPYQKQKAVADKWHFKLFCSLLSNLEWPQGSEGGVRRLFMSERKCIKLKTTQQLQQHMLQNQVPGKHLWRLMQSINQIYKNNFLPTAILRKHAKAQGNEGLTPRHNLVMGRVTVWHGVSCPVLT